MPRLLVLLALCNLFIGTGAFVLSGVLTPLAESLQVSVAAAGQAMTVYALSTAVLAPLALVLTGGWPRRRVLCLSLGLFALGNVVCALAGSLSLLLAGRVLMGVGAVFTAVAAGIAVALVEPARRGRALSLVFVGVSLSYVIGLPLGAWLGFRHGWQWPIALVGGLSGLASLVLAVVLPRDIAAPGATFSGLGDLLRQRQVAWALSLTLLYFIAIFCVFSYIGPVLQALVPMSTAAMSLTLMLFGLSGVIGTMVGGWANDRFGARRTLTLQLAVLGAMMLLVPLTRGQPVLLMLVLVVWGIAGFGMMTPQQSRLAALAPVQAPILLSLNNSMLYVGTALGAAIGGPASAWVGFDRLAWVGAPFALAGWLTLRYGPATPGAWRAA
ncbi:MFS transporter [uncultured Piscinibacter sp.]|uniref:MFS transporter n=1 Tax=uncultured Piscinibacter sp. TaxID=1131835 RepID=UPI00260D1C74|nr:MFS transporter [uncultured Piscinibacter sp.]